MIYRIIHGDCIDVLPKLQPVDCLFADPPDNNGLDYGDVKDDILDCEYANDMESWFAESWERAGIIWWSFNARHMITMAQIVDQGGYWSNLKPCVQTFTFGQHNSYDLGNCHRPLWRFRQSEAKLYPDQIRTRSWRQKNGDKRANAEGRIPGDVFDFPRVTGNSKQRRSWHPTQLHEGLVERCILLSTPEGGTVIDPFGGTGTTLRVCKRIGRSCTLIEKNREFCDRIAEEHGLEVETL